MNTELQTIDLDSKELSFSFSKNHGNLPSFGGKTLSENALKVNDIFEKTNELHQIFNHPMTQWAWKNLNLTNQSDYRNIRQVAAELASKKRALSSAKWKFLENEIKIMELEDQIRIYEEAMKLELNNKFTQFDIMKKKLEILQIKEAMDESLIYIEGAMKDVLIINDTFAILSQKYEHFSEEDFEKEEAKSNLLRSLSQSLRDVRERGAITKGEQEYLEQIGVNPSKVQIDMIDFITKIESNEKTDYSITTLNKWLEQYSNFLLPFANLKMLAYNLPSEPNKEITYN